ncbi:MAG: ATP-binding protein [Candidatus Omnitrophica bacterium]|nr:ATP-binding protein [Candidatus Omnitrophota bacterium]
MIERAFYKKYIEKALGRSRAVALLGPRQCGKTTLARQIVDSHSPNYFDLEDPSTLIGFEDPKTALEHLKGIVVIDEVQRRPEVFPVFRVLLDRVPLPAKFLILGSASPSLLKQSSESLAGRLELIEMEGFGLSEVGEKKQMRLWNRGGFPLSFLAKNDEDSLVWRIDFIRTFLERDLREAQGLDVPVVTLHKFWIMLAHSHGKIWNASPFAASLGLTHPTVRKYLDILTGLFMVRQLQPWYANIKKRQVKSPKVYIRDTGLLHALIGINTEQELPRHPICGSSWEGFVIEEIIRSVEPHDVYYWATHQGAEIDLVFFKGGRMYGIEVKRADAPTMTKSIETALECLDIERIAVIYPGKRRYSIHKKVDVVPFDEIKGGMKGLFGGKV